MQNSIENGEENICLKYAAVGWGTTLQAGLIPDGDFSLT
jgi:hypothetical protein